MEFENRPVKVGVIVPQDHSREEGSDHGLLWLIHEKGLAVFTGRSDSERSQQTSLANTLRGKIDNRFCVFDENGDEIEVILIKDKDHSSNTYALKYAERGK